MNTIQFHLSKIFYQNWKAQPNSPSLMHSRHFWIFLLDQESSYLTTFNTLWGRFRFLRIGFGLKMSQDVFQKKIDQAFVNCKGAAGIADDIQVFGTDDHHYLHLHETMERTRKAGIKLNYDKCIINSKFCNFFGIVYTPQGVMPDPKKIQVVKQMQAPSTKQELQSFIGMINYLSQFVPSISDIITPFRKLKRDVLFQWKDPHEEAFQKLKDSISSDMCLQYFDITKPFTLQVDASKVSLGAVLIQNDSQGWGKPEAFASKYVTSAETWYANTEHKMLAVVFGCIKFQHYLYGRKIICESDHKPLEDIHLKHLSNASPRLQRLLLQIQPYDFSIKYIPGPKIPMADELSRVSPHEKVEIKGLDVTIHELTPTISRVQVETIQEAMQQDTTLNSSCSRWQKVGLKKDAGNFQMSWSPTGSSENILSLNTPASTGKVGPYIYSIKTLLSKSTP